MLKNTIEIPFNFEYRDYQKGVRDFLRKGGKRGVCLWHRRCGKDKTFFNILVEQAIKNVGGYGYILPTYAQGKKVIWDSIDKDGKRFRDHIPPQIIKFENGQELKITLKNGSFIQILGSEHIDSLRGVALKGIIFSEYAFQNPTAWEVMRPVLAENGGWALFNSTPNGKNHFYDLCLMAQEEPDWYFDKLTVDDTGVVSKEYIEDERRQGMSDQMIAQEYYCSFDVGALGSYYADQVEAARKEGRIDKLPFLPDTPVDMYFDLGVNDSFTISFKQNDGQFFNFINYYEDTGKTLEHYFSYIDEWMQRHNAKLGTIFLPHDSAHKAQGFLLTGQTIIDKFQEHYGTHKVELIPNKVSVNDGIQEARKLFPRCRFDVDNAQQFIKCLENYKKDWDDVRKIFRDTPRHDWASHGADNFRYFAISDKQDINIMKNTKIYSPNYI